MRSHRQSIVEKNLTHLFSRHNKYRENKNGPKVQPCGTPRESVDQWVAVGLIWNTTFKLLPVKIVENSLEAIYGFISLPVYISVL